MSLSFVSKSIQTTREDGGYDEKPIENGNEIKGTTTTTYQKPLFEQLRENQERDETEREEEKLRMMRSTLALDEEDAAHLLSLQQYKEQLEFVKQQQTESEIEAFRRAQAEAQQQLHLDDDDDDDAGDDKKLSHVEDDSNAIEQTLRSNINNKRPSTKLSTTPIVPLIPKFIVKKRRISDTTISEVDKGTPKQIDNNNNNNNESTSSSNNTGNKTLDTPAGNTNKETTSATIIGLLSGYGSSSESDDDDE